ncbi:uncharacterized protein LOC9316607 isoform X4 [Arabidopsis lyrata subsp. lyrata]|uniref:uncharacterized protein LOC9316607 isoform X4 n=1 Tax=Arabidopsis lyrata subsp. lyrata TaxID=81972 RepID=UPI000A29D188|nr:uncharacterized protein LOC9316607 isoform X4 [Arabidopsis lyrata subsp. lyrata]|eukprot:XP_020884907.1 uncharacterized protein LOC9316607 isoform X4 [Arabidopsis lyrata subsp. lyrata]
MEFRYRAIDSNRPPPATETTPSQSPNPSFPFFSARSMSGKSEEQVREAMIQREIEKEKIRQEIIIAEAARKRELIAEVLQEMAIEREMSIRRVSDTGMSLEEKLIMWINQRKLPNQNQNQNNNNLFKAKYSYIDSLINTGSYNSLVTSPMMQLPQLQQISEATGTSMLESNKEKLIVLSRADHIGAKPKADSVGTMQLPQLQQMPETTTGTSVLESNKEKLIVLARADPVGEKRKAEDTQTGLNEDLQMKRQKSKESEAKTMSLESGEIVSSKLPCLGKLGCGKKVEIKVKSIRLLLHNRMKHLKLLQPPYPLPQLQRRNQKLLQYVKMLIRREKWMKCRRKKQRERRQKVRRKRKERFGAKLVIFRRILSRL